LRLLGLINQRARPMRLLLNASNTGGRVVLDSVRAE
jgi:hypothetical protein